MCENHNYSSSACALQATVDIQNVYKAAQAQYQMPAAMPKAYSTLQQGEK